MQRIRSVGVLSFAKISGLCYGAMGLCMVPFFLLFALIGSTASQQAGGAAVALPAIFGVGFAIMMPIFYAAAGFVFGALGAFVYNLMAGWIGGIEIEFELAPSAPTAVSQMNS